MSEKATLVKSLKRKGIAVPKGAKVNDLKHIDRHWLSGVGWLVRLVKPASRKPGHQVGLIPDKNTYWLPDSEMARKIVESKLVFVMGRSSEPPTNVTVIDVPKDYNDRWPINEVKEHGDNDHTNS